MRRMILRLLPMVAMAATAMSFEGCSSIDCPLNSRTLCVYTLGGDTLTDTLTVSTTRRDGSDTVLLNRSAQTAQFEIPMSYGGDRDQLLFDRHNTDQTQTLDTVTVEKDNLTHFEAVDCNPAFFHTLKSVSTTHHGIDSIRIVNPNVTFDNSHAHIQIYFKKR
ncbi:MAG: DUF6452 family protein [Prevotella sp.]|nr:DUF6452 family protein [Prevotella sp.]